MHIYQRTSFATLQMIGRLDTTVGNVYEQFLRAINIHTVCASHMSIVYVHATLTVHISSIYES
jgi:hypothetical protein